MYEVHCICAEPAALLHSLTRSLVAAAADMSEGPASKGAHADTSLLSRELANTVSNNLNC